MRRNFRSKSNRRTNIVDTQIREKHVDYIKALEAKAAKYGYIDPSLQIVVLKDEYFLSKPDKWIENVMGEWIEPVKRESFGSTAKESEDGLPINIPLHREENTIRIRAFRDHYKNSFNEILRAREKMKDLETKDVDIKNAIATLQALSQRKDGYNLMGKNEVMKCVIDFMGPNGIDYQHMIPPRNVNGIQRAKTV